MTSPLHHLLLCFFCIVYYCQHNEPTICFYYTIVVVSCCIILRELYMMFGSQVRFRFVDPDICFNPYCFDPQLTDKFCPNLLTNRFQTTWVFLRIGSNWMENWFDLEPSSDIMTWQTWGGQLKPQLTPAAGPRNLRWQPQPQRWTRVRRAPWLTWGFSKQGISKITSDWCA